MPRMHSYSRNGCTFDCDDDGPHDSAAIVLLHGFPQDRRCWQLVRPQLVAAGYRVLVPDQRGYSPGARPRGRRAYRQRELVGDVVALLDAAGVDRAHVVGHDWGGAVAWSMAAFAPDRLRSLTAVSTPHPAALARASVTSTQGLRSTYMGLFQLPVVPEQLFVGRGAGLGRRWLAASGLEPAQARRYLDRLLEPGAMTAALNWYRAMPLDAGAVRIGCPVDVPTLYVWSTGDTALGWAAAELTRRFVRGPYRFEVLDGVSHWIPEQAPQRLAALVAEHVAANS